MVAAFLIWRMWQKPGWDFYRWGAAVLGVGCAIASKSYWIGFALIFFLLALLPLYPYAYTLRTTGRRLFLLGTVGFASLFVVWGFYGWEWGVAPYLWNGRSVPMPTFWGGIRHLIIISQIDVRATYLLGEYSKNGFLAYFPITFIAKTPLPVLLFFPLAIVKLLSLQKWRQPALFLLLPAIGYFLLALSNSVTIGYRHLLPILPFLYILLAGGSKALWQQQPDWAARWISQWGRGVVVMVSLWFLMATVWIHPHYLSYFNTIFGGPDNGYKVVVDSNIDWGQDLIRLQSWLNERGNPSIKFSWFGSANPAYYGIQYDPLPGIPRHYKLWWDPPFNPEQPEPGIYVISVSNLVELPLEEKTLFSWFRAREPDARIGYSMRIYEVNAP